MLWIVAGPNGCGKSTFYATTEIDGWSGSVWIINPDLLTADIAACEGKSLSEANLAAVERIARWLRCSIEVYQTIGVETVLSTDKYRDMVAFAKSYGFRVKLLYVYVDTAELQLARIQARVANGGHDVDSHKVIARRQRSFQQLAWFLEAADEAALFDNSTGQPQATVTATAGRVQFLRPIPADLDSAIGHLRRPQS